MEAEVIFMNRRLKLSSFGSIVVRSVCIHDKLMGILDG